ncbi:uncharacterized protein ACHE_50892A [Aspergillus chevalieri]|uniref:C2H2 finger domain protein n=1 Tax=Aspergillus chevalieri TaxID=182096 RepID=A0A7R7VT88_ASPCH|nr:uncharacterized protein ACHE_50892A [Aspergillus chevalieri]BCR89694.1 hypothetical protein ACHE_50892A [Aspergillus chevalieri]
MKSSSEKHFRCTVCQRGFTRIDHLKRHQLRHSGLKPYSCVFCNEAFARCDNLRDHYADCAKRGDQKIPETGQRGRRRHACQPCMSMKLRCDGSNPCGSCQKRNVECVKEQKPGSQKSPLSDSQSTSTTHSALAPRNIYEPSSDRGSIKFLLNGGTDSFTEHFHLPPHTDRARGLEYHNQKGFEEAEMSILGYPERSDQPGYAPEFVESDLSAQSFFQDTFINFFQGPFPLGEPPRTLDEHYRSETPYDPLVPQGQPSHEPEKPFAMALIQAILSRAWTVPLEPKVQEEISMDIHFLLTTARIRKFVSLYSRFWHPNCPLVHIATFDPEIASLPLLTSIVFMGAIYSDDMRESVAAKRVLDFAELFVFSSHVFASEHDIGASFRTEHRMDDEPNELVQLQDLQAGYIMTVTQYWAGSRVSRNRAMETLFNQVVNASRRLGLSKCRHQRQDQFHESLWIKTESRIRIMVMIALIDSAFSFFQNYPCRLAHVEMDFDLPCEESLFNSVHPFSEPNFRFSRNLTVSEAFQSLFEECPEDPLRPPSPSLTQNNVGNPLAFTVFDMFLLIHLLYAFINTHMTLLIPILRKYQTSKSPSTIPDDSILAAIRTALSRWRDNWVTLHNQLPGDQWASMGFYKNGYNFWLVSQLLITKKESVDVVMRMEVKCEDKLEKLKVLLMDE